MHRLSVLEDGERYCLLWHRHAPAKEYQRQVADRERQPAPLPILLVEDEMLATVLEEMVVDAGHTMRKVARLSRAMELVLVRSEPFAAAALDVDVAGEPVFPPAALLREREVPFCFATGYAWPAW